TKSEEIELDSESSEAIQNLMYNSTKSEEIELDSDSSEAIQ
ncbi:20683_t:CDS:2, partial [Racocetra persica]